MKARHTYPAGQTSASRLKALLSCLEAERGRAEADAWLAAIRLARGDLEDETRLFPLALLQAAAVGFEERLPGALERAAPWFVARDNLGGWARALRGTRAPEEVFPRVDGSESEHARTTRWETLEARPGYWRGRVALAHDPALEDDGRLARLRAIELSVVPMLFGYPRGAASVVRRAEGEQELEVAWQVNAPARPILAGAFGGALVGGASLAAHPSIATAIAAIAAPLVGAATGLVWSRDRARRVEASAQATRVSALERSLALREKESRAGAGDLEGTVVAGQYRIGERMGSGASGVIYEATRITDGLPVAIKLLRAATAHDVTASDRLRRESEALGLSWHPNVVEVVDQGHLPDGTSYLVMELLRGETLAARLERKIRLSPEELSPIAKQLAEALVAIHAAGVVHRDLKPSNIYLVPDEEAPGGERVKVFDFGIARVEWEEMRITNVGAPLGTPGYMAPEQERGGEVDARSDVYAAGAVLYECLVGEPPPLSPGDMWTPGTRPPSSSGMRAAEGAPVDSGVQPASRRMPSAAPLAPAPPSVTASGAWRSLVERALAGLPDARFPDARGLLQALRALDGDPASIRPSAGSAGGGL